MFKKIIATVCIALALLSQTVFANDGIMLISGNSSVRDAFYQVYGEEKSADVFYNGEYISFTDVQPLVINGTTFVPIRDFCDTIGASIGFIDETWEVVIVNSGNEICFVAGTNEIKVNGQTKTLTSETFIIDGRTMVPVRLISEAFNLEVSWNANYRQVLIVDTVYFNGMLQNKFNLIEEALALSDELDTEKNIQITGVLNTSSGAIEKATNFTAEYTAIMNNEQTLVDIDANCSLVFADITQEINELLQSGYIDKTTADLMIEAMQKDYNFDMEIVFDMQNMDLYISCDQFEDVGALFFDQTDLTSDDILKISFEELTTDEKIALKDTFVDFIKGKNEYNIQEIYDELMLQSKLSNLFEEKYFYIINSMFNLLNDSAFEKNDLIYSTEGELSIDDVNYDYKIDIETDNTGEVAGYDFDVTISDIYSSQQINFSQNGANDINCSIIYSYLNENNEEMVENTEISIKKSQTTTNPKSIPTGNIVEISD